MVPQFKMLRVYRYRKTDNSKLDHPVINLVNLKPTTMSSFLNMVSKEKHPSDYVGLCFKVHKV